MPITTRSLTPRRQTCNIFVIPSSLKQKTFLNAGSHRPCANQCDVSESTELLGMQSLLKWVPGDLSNMYDKHM
jgi:hypothetical protein